MLLKEFVFSSLLPASLLVYSKINSCTYVFIVLAQLQSSYVLKDLSVLESFLLFLEIHSSEVNHSISVNTIEFD